MPEIFLPGSIALERCRVRVLHTLRVHDQERWTGAAPQFQTGRANLGFFLNPLQNDDERERTVWMIHRIDARIAKLAKLGLRPHTTMISYREELKAQLGSGGPYKLSVSSAFFLERFLA